MGRRIYKQVSRSLCDYDFVQHQTEENTKHCRLKRRSPSIPVLHVRQSRSPTTNNQQLNKRHTHTHLPKCSTQGTTTFLRLRSRHNLLAEYPKNPPQARSRPRPHRPKGSSPASRKYWRNFDRPRRH
ncbi:hypothetical protein PV04_09435 [Phialophora macrospora]|uniref:Uncharacterized protein n=1 Tax=Phialophora macrospora TaxID=1851006 RepID=A0A0D2DQR8_9EURO|nr:hypothetical protein PV04_09435 [Phialophora macrospora]